MLCQLRLILKALDRLDYEQLGARHGRATTKAQYILEEFNSVWTNKLGKQMHLACSEEEAMYLTRPNDALRIQMEIAKHTDNLEVIVDAFACVGGDALAAMYIHRNARVLAVQRAGSAEERRRFLRLRRNLIQFSKALPDDKVSWYPSDICHFLEGFNESISLLFLDPPWALGGDPTKISPAEVIRAFLKLNVFDALQTKPYLICFKLPHQVDDIAEWPGLPYSTVSHLHVRGKYHVYILQRI